MAGFFAAVQFTARGGRVECLLDWCVVLVVFLYHPDK